MTWPEAFPARITRSVPRSPTWIGDTGFRGSCGERSTDELAGEDVPLLLIHLAVDRTVTASMQNLYYNAVTFYLKEVQEQPYASISRACSKRYGMSPAWRG